MKNSSIIKSENEHYPLYKEKSIPFKLMRYLIYLLQNIVKPNRNFSKDLKIQQHRSLRTTKNIKG
ncbi:hypothetical protein SJAV_26450 [Sulfurisphaera javensis]|uniref:Transposase n=1 Tax=Sulfurisphaera javensis TaxID=2049879 RepID=A0AAT9GVE9_9CREN